MIHSQYWGIPWGEISLNLTYLYPETVSHLILTDATGGPHTFVNKQGSPKPQLSTDLNAVSSITDYDESKVKFKRNDEEHYNKMKLWPRRLKINANEIKQPTLIIWGRNDSSVSWKEGETYHQFLKIALYILLKRLSCTISPRTTRICRVCKRFL